MLQLVPLNDDVLLNTSYGRVSRPEAGRGPWFHTQGTLADEAIFGSWHDLRCSCGDLQGEAHEQLVCPRCGAVVGRMQQTTRRRFGHIQLAAPMPHPLFPAATLGVIPVLPSWYRYELPYGDDLNALYAQVLTASAQMESGGDPAALATAVRQLFANERAQPPRTQGARPLVSLSGVLCDPCLCERDMIGTLLHGLAARVALPGTEGARRA